MKRKTPASKKTVKKTLAQPVIASPVPVVAHQQVNRKTMLVVIGLAVLLLAVYSAKGFFIAATVNGQPISRLKVIQTLEKQGGKSALSSLVTDMLIADEAKKKGITVTDQEIDKNISVIEANIVKQGSTLDAALAQQGMTKESLRANMRSQKIVEKLVGDKTQVTDAEVAKYLEESGTTLPEGKETETKTEIKAQLQQQKFQQEAQTYVENLKKSAKITTYVTY